MTFAAFEQRVRETPDLDLSPFYWNNLLPTITGRAIWMLFIWPQIRSLP